ncbi:MAG TPA: IS66 family transposase [Anaerohalosphaeraceae bacterium]|nr:IS66 family transposase [Anaerohalosphaeraceae bacterium]
MKRNRKQCIPDGLPLGPGLTQQQAEAIYEQGKEAVVFALLQQAQMLAEKNNLPAAIAVDPSTPSAQKPVFTKDSKDTGKRRKRPGRKKGHAGVRRGRPERIDRTVEHRAEYCPDCGGSLKRCSQSRDRYVEDVPVEVRVETVRHVIHRDWCPACRKAVEPVVTDALPNSTIGNGIVVLSAWLHYALGNTISQILSVFNFHLQFQMSAGGLVQMWHRLADILLTWYEEIAEDIQKAGVLHGDETGWRVNGTTHWLWCFTSKTATIFTIERSRAGPVVLEFIKDCFDGVLVSDFWYAYNVLACAKQKCLVHLLRELERVWKYKDHGGDWPAFSQKLKRLMRDAIRLRKSKDDQETAIYQRRCERLEKRLRLILEHGWSNKEAKRLLKRLIRHQDELLTFLYHANVPFENNFGERSIRGAVIMRKNSFNNRSEKGASTQSVLMSVFFTLKQRGLNPVDTVKEALKIYLQTGNLPRLKEFNASNG